MYDNHILSILAEAGQNGLPIRKIARHVHGCVNGMFEPVSLESVHAEVSQYLHRNSRRGDSVIERMQKKGYYRLNMNSGVAREQLLVFQSHDTTN